MPGDETPGHSHSHVHDHDLIGWHAFSTSRLLQATAVLVGAAAVATVIALIVLWPSASGREAAIEQGAQVGLGSDRIAATVTDVDDRSCSYSTVERPQQCRVIQLQVDEGPFAGDIVQFNEFNIEFDAVTPDLEIGEAIVAGYEPSTGAWFYADRDRRTSLVWLGLLFAVVVIALGRLRGVAALVGMALTLVVLVGFVAPSVLDGNDPLVVAVVAAAAIAFVSLYLTHGFTPTTTVALAGTLASLGLTLVLTGVFFSLANFTGLATEEALLLPFIAGDLDLSGLLMGGAVLGTLGALDDVTVTQVATVAELRHRSPGLSRRDLVVSGIRVGRDHIASTVNTLLLAYVGASMPLLLLFAASDQPLDKIANSELISVEIVRTLCGSVGLVAAVPITTVLAALVVSVRSSSEATSGDTLHDRLGETLADSRSDDAADEPAEDDVSPDPSEPTTTAVAAEPDAVDTSEPAAVAEVEQAQRPPSWDDFAPDDEPW